MNLDVGQTIINGVLVALVVAFAAMFLFLVLAARPRRQGRRR